MPRKVISGHGSFNENYLALQRRTKLGQFEIPDGVTLTMYIPAGASLENHVANMIEDGNPIASTLVRLKATDGGPVKTLPTPYPYVYRAGDQVIDYTVSPPNGLTVHLDNNPHVVEKKTALRIIVEELVKGGFKDIHYACCGSGFSDSPRFSGLFSFRGYYVSL